MRPISEGKPHEQGVQGKWEIGLLYPIIHEVAVAYEAEYAALERMGTSARATNHAVQLLSWEGFAASPTDKKELSGSAERVARGGKWPVRSLVVKYHLCRNNLLVQSQRRSSGLAHGLDESVTSTQYCTAGQDKLQERVDEHRQTYWGKEEAENALKDNWERRWPSHVVHQP